MGTDNVQLIPVIVQLLSSGIPILASLSFRIEALHRRARKNGWTNFLAKYKIPEDLPLPPFPLHIPLEFLLLVVMLVVPVVLLSIFNLTLLLFIFPLVLLSFASFEDPPRWIFILAVLHSLFHFLYYFATTQTMPHVIQNLLPFLLPTLAVLIIFTNAFLASLSTPYTSAKSMQRFTLTLLTQVGRLYLLSSSFAIFSVVFVYKFRKQLEGKLSTILEGKLPTINDLLNDLPLLAITLLAALVSLALLLSYPPIFIASLAEQLFFFHLPLVWFGDKQYKLAGFAGDRAYLLSTPDLPDFSFTFRIVPGSRCEDIETCIYEPFFRGATRQQMLEWLGSLFRILKA